MNGDGDGKMEMKVVVKMVDFSFFYLFIWFLSDRRLNMWFVKVFLEITKMDFFF